MRTSFGSQVLHVLIALLITQQFAAVALGADGEPGLEDPDLDQLLGDEPATVYKFLMHETCAASTAYAEPESDNLDTGMKCAAMCQKVGAATALYYAKGQPDIFVEIL
jgi:hypothetical protein